jgi:hypothetical protein
MEIEKVKQVLAYGQTAERLLPGCHCRNRTRQNRRVNEHDSR